MRPIVTPSTLYSEKYTVNGISKPTVHDSQALDDLLDEEDKGQDLYADSAYTGEKQEATISKYEMNNNVHELQSNHEYL